MMSNEQLWLSVGLVGQAFFSMRFMVQWIASERRKESVIPISFWFFSIGGGLTLFTYALHRLDPVFILGEGAASSSTLETSTSFGASTVVSPEPMPRLPGCRRLRAISRPRTS